MSNVPLHPLVVHFPIVLSVLLPVVALVALWAVRRGQLRPALVWSVPLLLSVGLVASAFVATRTGEAEEDRVERVVSEASLHEHEEAAERFLAIAAVVAVIALAGLARGTIGTAARLVATAGSLVILFAGFQVGKAGGELVYVHNAASAYAQTGSSNEISSGDREEANDADSN